MKPYEWMVEYTPQTLWIEKKGLLIWLAEVSGALGGGLYLVALYFHSLVGMLIGWLVIATFKGAFHFAHLGRPLRFWRLALKPRSSWLARGFIFMISFIVFGAGQLLISYFLPGTVWEPILKEIAGVMAFLVIGYTGFLMNYVRGIPFWNSGLLPLLFVFFGIAGGLALMYLIGLSGYTSIDINTVFAGFRSLSSINILLITTYLWSTTYANPTGEKSVHEVTEGRTAPVLWVGVFFCGLIMPLGVSLYDYFTGKAPTAWLVTASIGVLMGVCSFNYCLLKGAYYGPLLPKS